MPCLSTGYDEDTSSAEIAQLNRDVERLEAALCSTLTFLENTGQMTAYYTQTDWKEIGLPKTKVASWWAAHQKKDRARRVQEAAARKKKAEDAARYESLSKKVWTELTPADRRFLSRFALTGSDRAKLEDDL